MFKKGLFGQFTNQRNIMRQEMYYGKKYRSVDKLNLAVTNVYHYHNI